MLKQTILAALSLTCLGWAHDAAAQTDAVRPTAVKLSKMKKAKKLSDFIENRIDFDKKACKVTNYVLYVQREGLDPAEYVSTTDEFPKKINTSAKKGDVFIFEQVKGKCTGDSAKRQMPNIVLQIE